jgi:hypothetical protein
MPQRQFSGQPTTRWLTEPRADRNMVTLEDFWFIDSAGKKWDAPANSKVDGASIPRFLWSIVGSPYTGDYRRASIVHDVACERATGQEAARREADRMFFEACRAGGCSKWDATILYIGVRFGAWFDRVELADDNVIRLDEPSDFYTQRQDFRSVCEDVLRQGESDDALDIQQRTDDALTRFATRKRASAVVIAELAAARTSHP